MIKSLYELTFSSSMNLKFEDNQVSYFFKLNQQYFFLQCKRDVREMKLQQQTKTQGK